VLRPGTGHSLQHRMPNVCDLHVVVNVCGSHVVANVCGACGG
jgi:hypothetical protein